MVSSASSRRDDSSPGRTRKNLGAGLRLRAAYLGDLDVLLACLGVGPERGEMSWTVRAVGDGIAGHVLGDQQADLHHRRARRWRPAARRTGSRLAHGPRTTMQYDRARVSLDRMPPTSLPRTSLRRPVNRTKASWSATAAGSPHRPEFLRPAQASYEVRVTVGPRRPAAAGRGSRGAPRLGRRVGTDKNDPLGARGRSRREIV